MQHLKNHIILLLLTLCIATALFVFSARTKDPDIPRPPVTFPSGTPSLTQRGTRLIIASKIAMSVAKHVELLLISEVVAIFIGSSKCLK